MEYRGVNYIHPEWQMMDQFFIDIVAPGYNLNTKKLACFGLFWIFLYLIQ